MVSGIGTVSVRSEPGATNVVVHYGLAGLPYETDCLVELKDGEAVLDDTTSTSGASRRTVTFQGLAAETIYEVVVTCDVAVSAPGADFFTTLPGITGNSVTYTVTMYPSDLFPNPDLEARLSYTVVPDGIPTLSLDTPCASGCTIDMQLTRGTVYKILHGWLISGDAVVRASGTRYVAVQ